MSSRFALVLTIAAACGVVAIAKELPAQVASEEPTDETIAVSEDEQWAIREKRAEEFRTHMLQGNAVVEEKHEEEEMLRADRQTIRSECLEILRRTNRERSFIETLRCWRKEIDATANITAARSLALRSFPNVSKDGAALFAARSDLQLDAYNTVLQAIDAEVYETEEELMEARANLETKYRVPALMTVPRVTAERTLAWIAYILLRLREFDTSTASPEMLALLGEIHDCFADSETVLEVALASGDHQEISTTLSQQVSKLQECTDLLQAPLPETPASQGQTQ